MAASIDLIKSCLDSVSQIADQVSDSILYLDAGCLEAFQFIGAFPLLLELGVHAVCSLENLSPLDITVSWNSRFVGPVKKVVVITSSLLSDAHRYILRCLGTHKSVWQCIIFTSISEIAHSAYVDSPLGPDAYHEYETLLLQDYEELMRKSRCNAFKFHQQSKMTKSAHYDQKETLASEDGWLQQDSSEDYDFNTEASTKAELFQDDSTNVAEAEDASKRMDVFVHHFPMVLCPISPRIFILPSEGTFAEACLSSDSEDSLSPGLPSICTGSSSVSEDVPPGATLTAHFLYNLAEKMDLKMDIFSLGDTSKIIGKLLTDMSSLYDVGRRHKKSAGLLLVDRTLDLLTPCCHGDSFLDRLLYSLPLTERISSSLVPKSSQGPKVGAPVKVQRAAHDIKIPFERIVSNDEPATESTQLIDGIKAFMSGWNSWGLNSESADHADKDRTSSYESLLNGSFLSNYSGSSYLESILDRRGKDGATLVRKWLLEALQHENIVVNLKGRLGSASISELHAMVKILAQNQLSVIRNRGIIQLALAAEIALSEPHSSHWDAFVSAERILNVSSVESSQSLSSQIRDFINTSILLKTSEQLSRGESTHNLLTFKDALHLSMIGYLLGGENFPSSVSSGPFSWEEEHSLKEAIVDAILEDPSSAKFRFLHGLEKELEANSKKKNSANDKDDLAEPSKVDDFDDQWDSWGDEDTDNQDEQAYGDMQLKLELRDRVDQLFKFFNKLSNLKWRNPTLREGVFLSSKYGSDIYEHKGLLYKLLTTIFAKYEVPGLEYHSSAVGRLLKSGFGRFGLGQAKPSFGDQNVLVVFVVGGINGVEVLEAMEAISENSRPDTEFILGGTTLLTPSDMFNLLLGSSSYM